MVEIEIEILVPGISMGGPRLYSALCTYRTVSAAPDWEPRIAWRVVLVPRLGSPSMHVQIQVLGSYG